MRNVLSEFVSLSNVFVSDLIKYDEINYKAGSLDELERIQVIQASSKDIIEAANLQKHNKKLSF